MTHRDHGRHERAGSTAAPRRRITSRLATALPRALGGLLMLTTAATFLFFGGAQTAHAASYGPGFDDAQNHGQGRIGAYSFDGRNVYCLQPWLPRPLDETTRGELVGGAQFSMSDGDTARVNWAISTHGQSQDPVDTSAVAMYVWSLAAPESYNGHEVPGDEHYLARVPEVHRTAVAAKLASIHAAAAAVGTTPAASYRGSLEFTSDPGDPRMGTVTLATELAGSTGEVTLHHAVFAANGQDTATLVAGDSAAITVPAANFAGGPVTVSATAKVTTPAQPWAAKILLLHTPGAQLLGASGGTTPGTFTAIGQDRVPRVSTPSASPSPTRTAAPARTPSPRPTASPTPAPLLTPTKTPPAATLASSTPTQAPTTVAPTAPTPTRAPNTAPPASPSPEPTATPTSPITVSTDASRTPTPSDPADSPATPASNSPSSPPATATPAVPSSPPAATTSPAQTAASSPTASPTASPAATLHGVPAPSTSQSPTTSSSSSAPVASAEALATTGSQSSAWPLALGTAALLIGLGALAWGLISRRRAETDL